MRYIIHLLIICLLSFVILSCKKDEEIVDMNYIIPPDDSMQADFSSFNDIKPATRINLDTTPDKPDIDLPEFACWYIGYNYVLWSNVVCFLPLAIPIAAFKALKEQQPTKASTSHAEWSWKGQNNSFLVVADKKGGEYTWEWSVKINDFEWITGGSMEDKTKGWWQFHDPNLTTDKNETIKVEWTKPDAQNATVKFINNNQNDAMKLGDYIEYTVNNTDITVYFYDMHKDIDTDKNGSISETERDNGNLFEAKVFWNTVSKKGGIVIVKEDNEGTAVKTGDTCNWDPND